MDVVVMIDVELKLQVYSAFLGVWGVYSSDFREVIFVGLKQGGDVTDVVGEGCLHVVDIAFKLVQVSHHQPHYVSLVGDAASVDVGDAGSAVGLCPRQRGGGEEVQGEGDDEGYGGSDAHGSAEGSVSGGAPYRCFLHASEAHQRTHFVDGGMGEGCDGYFVTQRPLLRVGQRAVEVTLYLFKQLR